jgi:hypothetical protein
VALLAFQFVAEESAKMRGLSCCASKFSEKQKTPQQNHATAKRGKRLPGFSKAAGFGEATLDRQLKT